MGNLKNRKLMPINGLLMIPHGRGTADCSSFMVMMMVYFPLCAGTFIPHPLMLLMKWSISLARGTLRPPGTLSKLLSETFAAGNSFIIKIHLTKTGLSHGKTKFGLNAANSEYLPYISLWELYYFGMIAIPKCKTVIFCAVARGTGALPFNAAATRRIPLWGNSLFDIREPTLYDIICWRELLKYDEFLCAIFPHKKPTQTTLQNISVIKDHTFELNR